jgi:hypothetical protein
MQDNNTPTPGAAGCHCVCHKIRGVDHIRPCCDGPEPDPTYGTTHLVPTPGGGTGTGCCGTVVAGPNDVMTSDAAAVTCPGRNAPLTADQAYAGLQLHEGNPDNPWTLIGEYGEQALMAGHGKAELLIAAMVKDTGCDPSDFDTDECSDTWLVITEHMPDCREDREADEFCSCDEFGWWATTATADTPGALPVTYWSV